MKKISILLLCILSSNAFAQNGLRKIEVETYYVSDSNDAAYSKGKLPVGSVTYRVYVEMLPGYRFQAVYGIPNHELKIATSTSFYNDDTYGASVPNVIPLRVVNSGLLLLDSWISVGAAAESSYGVLKSNDNGVNTLVNSSKVLQNNSKMAGISLAMQDGLVQGNPARVTAFGIDSALAMFGHGSTANSFITTNGSWASLYGSIGPDSLHNNQVLIGQFTTDGVFSFEFNIQLGTPFGGVENYVARNPNGTEILRKDLVFTSSNKATRKQGMK
ncbi:MAG: hypothetical protein IPP56_14900 [Bacteroidetes bacterium]|nr:hypothetical protein [Bacteroidota bacterium]